MRFAALAGLVCFLSGCWLSRTQLVDAGNASKIGWAGRYVGVSPGGTEEALVIVKDKDRGYMIGDGERQLYGHFLDLGRGWYVAELEVNVPSGKLAQAVFFDMLLHKSANAVEMYQPVCDAAVAGAAEVERDDTACELKSLAALRAVAANVISRIASGELKQAPQVFRPA